MSSLDAPALFTATSLVAVITGGGSGLGLMMAKALALNGAHKVYIIGRRSDVLAAAAKESPHGNIVPIVGDTTSKESLETIVKQIEDEVGYVNVVIANSGSSGPDNKTVEAAGADVRDFQRAMWETGIEEYTDTFKVNCAEMWFFVVAFLGLLDEGNRRANVEQRSQIIATTAIGGLSRNGKFAYGQSKAATTHLIKQLATQLVPYGIRANVLAPGGKS